MTMQNNNTNNNNVSTRGFQFYNQNVDERDCSTLAIEYWNDYLTLKISPLTPERERKGKQVYDYENGLSGVLNLKNMLVLLEGIDQVQSGEIPSITVDAGINKRLKFSNGEEYGLGYCLAIIETAPNSDIFKDILIYVFNTNSDSDKVKVDYNEETGEYEERYINVEVKLFKRALNASIDAFIKAQTHNMFYRSSFEFSKITNVLTIIKSMIEQLVHGRADSVNMGMPNTSPSRSAYGDSRSGSRRRRSGGTGSTVTSSGLEAPASSPAPTSTVAPASPSTGGTTRRSSRPVVNNIEEDIDIDELEKELLD